MKDRQAILTRLKTVEGHIRGVYGMVEEESYCIDVINQILAVQRALDKCTVLMLEMHLEQCVSVAINSSDDTQRHHVLWELVQLFEKTKKL